MTPIADMVELMLEGGVAHRFIVLAIRSSETLLGLSADMSQDNRRTKERERKRAARAIAKENQQNQALLRGAQANDGASVSARNGADMSADTADKRSSLASLLSEKGLTEEVSKSKKKEVDGSARGTRLSADAALCERDREFAREFFPDDKIDQLWTEFRDYWISVPGARGRKANWFATWRNRVRDIAAKGMGNGRAAWKSGREPSAITAALEQHSRDIANSFDECGETCPTPPRLISHG